MEGWTANGGVRLKEEGTHLLVNLAAPFDTINPDRFENHSIRILVFAIAGDCEFEASPADSN